MLLILIYMTRPTATRNHRRVHRDGNYKFMQPSPPPSRDVRKKFRPGRFAIRVPSSSSPSSRSGATFVSCFCLFFSRPICWSIERGTMDSQNACNGPSRTGGSLDLVKMMRKIVRGFGLSCFTLGDWFARRDQIACSLIRHIAVIICLWIWSVNFNYAVFLK